MPADELKATRPPEDGATIRAVVVGQIKAGRVGLGMEEAVVAEGRQRALQDFEVIHFLEADDIRSQACQLLENKCSPDRPLESFPGAPDKTVVVLAQCCQHTTLLRRRKKKLSLLDRSK